MKSFKEHLQEAKDDVPTTDVMSSKDILKYVSRAKLQSIAKHPFFRDNFNTAQNAGIPIGFRYSRKHGFETIDVAHGPMGEDKPLRRMVQFVLAYNGRAVRQAHLYNNWDNDKRDGRLVWKHVKSV